MNFSIRRSRKAKRVRIAVHSDGDIVVSGPLRLSDAFAARAIESHRQWIERMIEKQKKMTVGLQLEKDVVDRREFLREVADLVRRRAGAMGVHVRKVSVRKMRSRWGSCSKEGNITINLLLGHLPDELLEYVAVHELCHLVHHNHSKSFWDLVHAYLPDFKQRKIMLNRYGYLLRRPR
jgi:predicted metal-dependent hydrolase